MTPITEDIVQALIDRLEKAKVGQVCAVPVAGEMTARVLSFKAKKRPAKVEDVVSHEVVEFCSVRIARLSSRTVSGRFHYAARL